MRGEALARIAVAIAGDEHLWFDLTEAVEHALHAEIRRTGGEDRAYARGSEHGDNGFGTVRHEGGDTVALADAP